MLLLLVAIPACAWRASRLDTTGPCWELGSLSLPTCHLFMGYQMLEHAATLSSTMVYVTRTVHNWLDKT